ncbi:MAG: TrbC/VirB2 family protein [Wolbachia endosymbiont of Tyrophagus putrescentiae]|nr:TrbC/VirB2 family protein [Wolbachia endosymbiont of Tyrophagus putrescentiae]
MKFFNTLVIALILSFAFDASAVPKDNVSGTICNVIGYIQDLGVPIVTVVIIGAALLAIFGKMPWPALVALGVFVAAFFGAPKIVSTISPETTQSCCESGKKWDGKVCK